MDKRGKQDYLRVIYELEDGKGVKSTDIADKLKVTKASVSEMIRKLAEEGFLNIKPYSKIKLTTIGKNQAEKLFDKHILVKRFIKQILDHEEDFAYEEAHQLEHFFSDRSIEKIGELLDGKQEKEFPNYVG